jgi:uncharacterized membrane protein
MDLNIRATAGAHLLLSLLVAAISVAATAPAYGWATSALFAWTVAAGVFLIGTWAVIWRADARGTARLAKFEDSSRAIRDLVLLAVSVGALLTVALVIFRAHESGPLRTMLGVACVAASWTVVHTILTLRYARLYYSNPQGGLSFKQDADPTYRDFASVAFTIGMTFQVSDTEIQTETIRSTVLGHALVSFVFDAVIIAVTINVVAGLGS